MDGYSISQAAERTGFPASTLRYYEEAGLVHPTRTAAGYRTYDDDDLELLTFIGRAKGFGLRLDEVADLLVLLDGDRCAPVQDRLRELVEAKVVDARAKVAELVAFTAELQRVAARLRTPAPDGPCDASCACTNDLLDAEAGAGAAAGRADGVAGAGGGPAVPVALVEPTPPGAEPAIACTLSSDQVGERLAEWHDVLATAVAHDPITDGVRVRFGPDGDVGALATLAAAEQGCCRFFTFAVIIGPAGVALDVTGPDEAQPVIRALVGVAP